MTVGRYQGAGRYFTRQIYEIWLPAAVRFGIPYETFWRLTPADMFIYQEQYRQKQAETCRLIEEQAYIQGIYTSLAIGAALSKNVHFPKQPIHFFTDNSADETKNTECHERMASDEMAVWSSALKKQGLKETKY